MARQLDFTGFVSAQDHRTFPTNDIRNLEIQGGNPAAILNQGQQQSADLGSQVLDILRQYQKFGRSQELGGQQEQIRRTFQTPSELIGAAPGVQAGERAARVGAVEPTISGARSLVSEAGDLLKDFQLQEDSNIKRAQDIIDNAISSGSSGLEELMRVAPDVFKKAKSSVQAYEAILKGIKTKELEEKRRFNVKEAKTTSGFGQYTEDQLKAITKINQDVSKNATYAKTTSMRTFADNVTAALAIGNGVSDIAAINQFQKVIDEGAVTRDQDVNLIQSAQSLANTLQTKLKGLQKGDKLSVTQRTQMRTIVENLYQSQVKALLKDPYIAAKTKETGLYGITTADTVLGELGGFQSAPPPSTRPKTMQIGKDIYILGPNNKYKKQ